MPGISHMRRAFLWMTGTLLSFTTAAVATREISHAIDTPSILLYRSILSIFLVLIAIRLSHETFREIFTSNLKLHIVRNTFHFVGQFAWFYSLTVITLAEVFALEFTIPLWIALLGPIFLKEKLTWQKAIYTAIGFSGVLIVLRPLDLQVETGSIVMLIGAAGFAMSIICTRYLMRTNSALSILFYMSVVQFPIALAVQFFHGPLPIPDLLTSCYVILIAICGLTAHYCFANALKLAEALTVAPIDYLRLPLIIVIGVLLYSEAVDAAIIAGSILIVVGNYMNIRTASGSRNVLPRM